MKLKKIASLALAGVMAVSMLTACDTASNGNTNGNDDVIVTPVPTSIVTAVNDGQSATNDVKINFPTDDDADWVKIGDYYYYTEAVPVAGEGVENWTTPLFTGVDVINEALKTNADAKFSVYVYHESVQADPDNLTTAADIAKLFENA